MREPPLTSAPAAERPLIVLDTNVVLDWLLFGDPASAPLAAAITRGQLRWIATTAMRDELAEVLRRGLAAARGVDPATVLAAWDDHAKPHAEPSLTAAHRQLRCTDPDDQKFVDLALAAGARWLLSRDRAVLRLARRAAAFGTTITAPQFWAAPH